MADRGRSTSRGASRGLSRWAAVLASLAALAVLVVATAAGLCVVPRADEPATSDVIVVLGPPLPDRSALADRLMREGRAKELVVSTYGGRWSPDAPLCDHPQPYPVTCFVADPATTRGEAQELGRLQRERGWTSLQLVTFGPHVNRARVIVGRCVDADVAVIRSEDPVGFWEVAHHTGGWLKLATYWRC